MYNTDDHMSWMMLGLLNTLRNNGTITKEERESILGIGYYIEEQHDIEKAKKILAKLEE